MDATKPHAPAGWLEALAESEAELAAGLSIPGEFVRQHLLDSIARLEAKQTTAPRHGATTRR